MRFLFSLADAEKTGEAIGKVYKAVLQAVREGIESRPPGARVIFERSQSRGVRSDCRKPRSNGLHRGAILWYPMMWRRDRERRRLTRYMSSCRHLGVEVHVGEFLGFSGRDLRILLLVLAASSSSSSSSSSSWSGSGSTRVSLGGRARPRP